MHPIEQFEKYMGFKGFIYMIPIHKGSVYYIAGNNHAQDLLKKCGLKYTGKFEYEWLLKYVSDMGYCLETDRE